MMPQNSPENPWEIFQQELQTELEQSRRSLRELTVMYEQSQNDLTKITQRNAAITAQLQQMRSQPEGFNKVDIQAAYASALDTQQRMLVMRGQLEKLQTEQASIQRYVTSLEKTLRFLSEGNQPPRSKQRGSGTQVLEMVIDAQETERQRLSRQMHDGPAQALSNFIVQAEIAARLFDMDPNRAKEELDSLKSAAMTTFQKVRVFITELRPMMLDDLGLIPTIRRYVDTFKEQTGVDVNLSIQGVDRRLESYVEVMIFRALQELMSNAVRHNQDLPMKLQITVQLIIDEHLVKVAVGDNGKGFNSEAAGKSGGFGLKLIRERVEMLGGTMDIDSSSGQGTRILFQIPVESFTVSTDTAGQSGTMK